MIRQSKVSVEIDLSTLPFFEGALKTVEMGIFGSLQPDNLRLKRSIQNHSEAVNTPIYALIFDPQTSGGGLLASVPAKKAGDCLRNLIQRGYPRAAIIGRVKAEVDREAPVALVL